MFWPNQKYEVLNQFSSKCNIFSLKNQGHKNDLFWIFLYLFLWWNERFVNDYFRTCWFLPEISNNRIFGFHLPKLRTNCLRWNDIKIRSHLFMRVLTYRKTCKMTIFYNAWFTSRKKVWRLDHGEEMNTRFLVYFKNSAFHVEDAQFM